MERFLPDKYEAPAIQYIVAQVQFVFNASLMHLNTQFNVYTR